MRIKKKLGEMLIEGRLLTADQLKSALNESKKAKMKLGQYLVRHGIIRESQIVDTISKQLQIKVYSPIKYPLNMDLANLVNADQAQKYQLIPIKKNNNLITAAMPDPIDLDALDAIELLTNSEVEPVICTENEFNSLLGALYGKFTNYDGILGELEEMQIGNEEETEKAVTQEEVEVDYLQDLAEEAPVIRLVNSILSQAVRENASDVHISPEKRSVNVRFRVDGKLQSVPSPPSSMFLPIVSRLKILANMDIAVSRIPQDGRFTLSMSNKEINVRASTIPTIYGENIVLRLLNVSAGVYSFDSLGMSSSDIQKLMPMIRKPYGMILSTGPTGSGKTTSLYSILKEINRPDTNIITLEDPVEYRVEGIRQVQLNQKAGMTFASGLRSILRQDPDVIMVGEIRDHETASISVQAALTGHRVLSTVHTNDAAGAIVRMIDMGIEPFLTSSVMLVSIAQRLVRRICPECKVPYTPPPEAMAFFGIDQIEGINFYRGEGCFRCMDTGYRGRTGIFEVLTIDDQIREMINKRASAVEITNLAKNSGTLRTLKDDAAEKIRQGITTIEEAMTTVMF